jgi:hypothetical protein
VTKRSVTLELPPSPRAVIQRSGGKTVVVLAVEEALDWLEQLEKELLCYPNGRL